MEIYDEDTLNEFELQRQKNIIKNYEFMKACGLPVKPLIYVKRVFIPLEEQFKYLSDESSDDSDEEWTEGPSKKKEKIDPTANQGINFSSVTFEKKNWIYYKPKDSNPN